MLLYAGVSRTEVTILLEVVPLMKNDLVMYSKGSLITIIIMINIVINIIPTITITIIRSLSSDPSKQFNETNKSQYSCYI